MIKKSSNYNTPIIMIVSYKLRGKTYGYRLVPRKIELWPSGRGSTILKSGACIEILVKYPDGATNSMTCKTIDDLKWAFKCFYKEYLKDFENYPLS